jgi:hypothetical protein
MSDERKQGRHAIYQIRVRGILDRKWSDWFDGMDISTQGNGDTLMTGPVVDQAALHGLLHKIRDIGLPLLSVNIVEAQDDD